MLICVRHHFMNFQRQTHALPSLLQCFTSLNALISAGKKMHAPQSASYYFNLSSQVLD